MRAVRELAGVTCLHRFPLMPCPTNKQLHHLLLLCLVLLIFCFTISGNISWSDTFPLDGYYQRLFNSTGTSHKFRPPAFFARRSKINITEPELPPPTNSTATFTSYPPPTTEPFPLFHQAYAPNYHFTMDNPHACRDPPFLVLMVPVAPKNVEARNAIRSTWAKEHVVLGQKVLTMFMLGKTRDEPKTLSQENLEHQDLIQSDFTDSYLNLTIKTMVIMQWLSTRCNKATFAMKVDSDMFLNIDNLVGMLKEPQVPQVNYLTGYLMWNRPVVRSKKSKWYVSEAMYPEPKFPTYCLGAGYVFSNDLPAKFVDISSTIKPFNIEDAYIGMCMKKLGLAPTSPPNPGQFKAYNSRYNRCEFSRVITYILGSSQQLLNYWADLKRPGPPC